MRKRLQLLRRSRIAFLVPVDLFSASIAKKKGLFIFLRAYLHARSLRNTSVSHTFAGMDDKTYHRLLNACIDHVLTRLGPRLDRWAEGRAERWRQSWARDEKTIEREGREHWQARRVACKSSTRRLAIHSLSCRVLLQETPLTPRTNIIDW